MSYLGYTGFSIFAVGLEIVLYKNLGNTDNEVPDIKHEDQIVSKPRHEGMRVQFDLKCTEILSKTRELSNLLDEVGGNFLSSTFKNYKNRFIYSKNFSLDN